jgi:hypothetical protein
VGLELRERLLVSKRAAHDFDMQKFDVRNINSEDGEEQCQ